MKRKYKIIVPAALTAALCFEVVAFAGSEASSEPAASRQSTEAAVTVRDGKAEFAAAYDDLRKYMEEAEDGSLLISGLSLDSHEPAALYTDSGRTVIEDSAFSVYSEGSSTLKAVDTAEVIVKNSIIKAESDSAEAENAASDSEAFYTSGILGSGTVTAGLSSGQTHTGYDHSLCITDSGAVLKAENAEGSGLELTAYDTDVVALHGGCGVIADKDCRDYLYASNVISAEDGAIVKDNGMLTVGSSLDAAEAVTADGNTVAADMAEELLEEDVFSTVIAGRNAVVICSSGTSEEDGEEEIPYFFSGNASLVTEDSINLEGFEFVSEIDNEVYTVQTKGNDTQGYSSAAAAYADYIRGASILVSSSSADITLANTDVVSSGGTALLSTLNPDPAAGYLKKDTAKGINITMEDSEISGSIIHDDYQRDMNITAVRTMIDGAVNYADANQWNNYWSEYAEDESCKWYGLLPDSYVTDLHETNLTLLEGSVWNAPGTSRLTTLTVSEDSFIEGEIEAEEQEETEDGLIIYRNVTVTGASVEDTASVKIAAEADSDDTVSEAGTAETDADDKPIDAVDEETGAEETGISAEVIGSGDYTFDSALFITQEGVDDTRSAEERVASGEYSASEALDITIIDSVRGHSGIIINNTPYSITGALIEMVAAAEETDTGEDSENGSAVAAFGENTEITLDDSVIHTEGAGTIPFIMGDGAAATLSASEIHSDTCGMMITRGGNSLILENGTVVDSGSETFLVRNGASDEPFTASIDDAAITNSGVLIQIMDNDAAENDGSCEQHFSFTNGSYTGNIYNATGTAGLTGSGLYITLGEGTALSGAAASTSVFRVNDGRAAFIKESGGYAFDDKEEAASFAEEYKDASSAADERQDAWYTANLINYSGSSDIIIQLEGDAVWNVTGTSMIKEIKVEDDASVVIPEGTVLIVGEEEFTGCVITAEGKRSLSDTNTD